MDLSNDIGYLQKLVAHLQQQRNTGNDMIAHLSSLLVARDEQIAQQQKNIEALTETLKAERAKVEDPLPEVDPGSMPVPGL